MARPSSPSFSYMTATTTTITVRWYASSGATEYRTEAWYNGSMVGSQQQTTGTSSTHTGLTAGRTYEIKLYARNSDGNSTPVYQNKTTAPPSVTGLSASTGTDYASVSWNSSLGASRYRIVARLNSSSGSIVDEIQTSSTSTFFSGLSSGTYYYFGVVPANSDGDEGPSNAITVRTQAGSPPSSPSFNTLTATSTSISISWYSSSGATSYVTEIWYNGSIVGSQQTTTGLSTTHGGLTSGRTYEVKLFARNANGNSTPVYRYKMTAPPQATNFRYTSIETTSINLAWNSSSGATSYRVVVRRGSSSGSIVSERTVSTTSTSFTGLSPNTEYYFGIVPYNSDGDQGQSNNFTTATRPNSPLNLRILNTTGNSINASFTSPSGGAYRYYIRATPQTGNSSIKTMYSTSNVFTITGLEEYTEYYVEVFSENSYGLQGGSTSGYAKTKAVTPPTVSVTGTNTKGVMSVYWTADGGPAGLRENDTFATAISGRNNSNYSHYGYTNAFFQSFSFDGNGEDFVPGSFYHIRVTAYNSENLQTSTYTGALYFEAGRPPNWYWSSAVGKDLPFMIHNLEWTSLGTRINQFRTYKGIQVKAFYPVSAGDTMKARDFNDYRNAIRDMTSNSSLPPTVSVGSPLYASYFLGLTTALNSIP